MRFYLRDLRHSAAVALGILLAFSFGAAGGWFFHSPAFLARGGEGSDVAVDRDRLIRPPHVTVEFVSERSAPDRDYGYHLGAVAHLRYVIE